MNKAIEQYLKAVRVLCRYTYAFHILIIIFAILFSFLGIQKLFFSQDEWLGFGLINAAGQEYVFLNVHSIIQLVIGTGRVLSGYVFYLFFNLFGLNYLPFAFFQLSFHILNTLMVYLLLIKYFRGNIAPLVGSLFFGINSVAISAVLWPAASIGTLPATTLILLSIWVFLKAIGNTFEEKTPLNLSLLGVSLLLLYISMHFKEIGIFLFLLFPASLVFLKHGTPQKWKKLTLLVVVLIFIIAGIRLLDIKNMDGDKALFLTGSNKYYEDSLIVRAVLYPLTSFSLMFIPPSKAIEFSRYLTNVYYPFISPEQFALVAQTVVLDLVAIVVTFLIIIKLFIISKVEKLSKNIIFWLLFTLMSFLPYIVISKSYSYLESRYYYLALVGGAFVLSYVASFISKKKSSTLKVVFILLIILLLGVHALELRSSLDREVKVASERKGILTQLEEIQPTLYTDKNVFLIQGDQDFYIPDNKVPFQQGMGYTLMAFYYHSENIPAELIKNNFLFELGSQGYKEDGNKGFGYFYDEELLKRANITAKASVIKLYYDSQSKTLRKM